MTGAGWGGCIVVLAEADRVPSFRGSVCDAYRAQTGLDAGRPLNNDRRCKSRLGRRIERWRRTRGRLGRYILDRDRQEGRLGLRPFQFPLPPEQQARVDPVLPRHA